MLIVGCMVRTGSSYLPDFFDRVDKLAALVPALRVVVGENDSRDNTKDVLATCRDTADYEVTILDCGDGSQHYPSIDNPDRWHSICGVMNKVLDEVRPSDRTFMYIDPDLIWEPDMIVRLLVHDVEVAAPLAWHHSGRVFDLWGTRRNGVPISRATDQFWDDAPTNGLIEVDSVACCNVLDARIARKTRFGEWDANVGWHADIRSQGHKIWLDLDEKVIHP